MSVLDELREWYEPDGDPREALGRMARRLKGGGALYLGGGVGVESTRSVQAAGTTAVQVERYKVTPNGSTHDGPLSAVTAAFVKAGSMVAADTPGGTQKVTDPAIAARLHELDASEREERGTIRRYEARVAARAKQGAMSYVGSGYGPSIADDSGWEARRMEEARANIAAIEAERRRLLSGKAQEAAVEVSPLLADALHEAEAGKPGTNWKQVSPQARKKVDPLVKHWMKSAHPFGDCVKELAPEKGADAAKRICAVVKDMGMKSTHWRKGGKGGKVTEGEAAVEAQWLDRVELAESRLAAVDEALGEGAAARIAMSAPTEPDTLAVAEMCFEDVSVLFLAGDPRAAKVLEGRASEQPRHRDGKWTNVLDRVRKVADPHPLEGPDRELRVNTPHPEPEPVTESGLLGALIEAQ